jgi:hypothetical protein
MQFGRFHGIALLALGAILLFVQAVVSFEDRSASAAKAASQQRAEAEGRPPGGRLPGLVFLPGIIGLALAGSGIYALVQVQRRLLRGEMPEENAPSTEYGRREFAKSASEKEPMNQRAV